MKTKLTCILALGALLTFSSATVGQTTPEIKASAAAEEENSCLLTVYNADGSLASDVVVTTDVSGGLFCVGGRDFTTDSRGRVRLLWLKYCKLEKLYIKGKTYKVSFENGKAYDITLRS